MAYSYWQVLLEKDNDVQVDNDFDWSCLICGNSTEFPPTGLT